MLFLTSCERRIKEYITRTVKYSNKSSKDISIISYHHSYNSKSEYTHKIEKGGKFEQTYNFNGGNDYPRIINESDSVKVIFDNERQSTFVRDKDIENPYNIYNSKKNPNKGGGWHTFLEYTFTDKDYEYAKPCNGKCN